jgi:Ser-tRNA(Ala) deacylase AlaX
MATKLVYLEDFDVVSGEATVVGTEQTEDGRTSVILDQTCFYPRGGGQDWDTGIIKSPSGSFMVHEVRLDEQGTVQHIGSFTKGKFVVNETVQCQVHEATRHINTRLHSAGHLIDMAMSVLKPDWLPVRGAHYPHMSFVEYQVAPEEQINETFVEQVQSAVKKLTQSSYQNQLRFMSKDEMAKYCRHVPENLPANKPSRIVLYADNFGIPCGGTHVKNVQEIDNISVTKAKIKKGLAKISYAVSGIN